MKFASTGLPAESRQPPCVEASRERSPRRGSQAGFSLLETLIALSILAIALVSLFQAHSTGLRTVAAAEGYAQARILAHSLLAGVLAGPGDLPRSADGRAGALRWSIDVAAARDRWAAITSKNWRLHRIRVTVAWGRGRRVELEGVKLARAQSGD